MTTETRAEATERVTCQASAWLWHSRKCRAIALEAGLARNGMITTAWRGAWRIDIAAAFVDDRRVKTFVVEVKGTAQDLARERVAAITERSDAWVKRMSKWHQEEFAELNEMWIACGDLKTGWLAFGDVPEHWGVVVFDAAGDTHVLRKVEKSPTHVIGDVWAHEALCALAEVQTAERMPRAFNARRRRHLFGRPWERLIAEGWARREDAQWVRDNKQGDLFHGCEQGQDQRQHTSPRPRVAAGKKRSKDRQH